MKSFLSMSIAILLCCFKVNATNSTPLQTRFEITTPIGAMTIYRPNFEEVERQAPAAKAIFVEAFSTTYTEYHRKSGSTQTIESWLRLRPGQTLQSWLNLVFDEEYAESLTGSKFFIFLSDSEGTLIGWLSHSPLSENGDLYLSQCSLEAASRNHKVATAAFEKAFKDNLIQQMFPGAKEVKLIARKINTIAHRLYIKAGFIVDETIDPAVYGDSYDDRYIGFRLKL